ncbi:MAG: hypothetical protein OXC91_11055 [Rhodobacteraceae bacterium]|nr:hypothetical protein [Paracoccaceae bacterium]
MIFQEIRHCAGLPAATKKGLATQMPQCNKNDQAGHGFRALIHFIVGSGSSLAMLWASSLPAHAHASEQVFVALLPTDLYTALGTGIVALTILLLLLLPHRYAAGLFATRSLPGRTHPSWAPRATSLAAAAILLFLIVQGFTGTRDPLTNLMPVTIWTVWWIGLFLIQGILGDVWRWINPWSGPGWILQRVMRQASPARLPAWLGSGPAVLGYICFVVFLLADPAPDDPDRLALFVMIYWLMTLAGMILFGPETWLRRCECFTILFSFLARLSFLRIRASATSIGLPGWQLTRAAVLTSSQAIFVLVVLASSSFDGLNETFWWLDLIGVNPLEFPGRSAVIGQTVLGILGGVLLLIAAYTTTVLVGDAMARRLPGEACATSRATAFGRLALSLLPIAFGYHIAHFFPTLLVNAQYTLVALSDPLSTGADYFNLGHHFVTLGFLAELGTVHIIWLTQCAAIVFGHVLAVLVGHRIMTDLYGKGWRAILAEVPLSILMILYTMLSLWLLASPRGV